MALRNADRVVETSSTTGTGTLSLNGAVMGFRSFLSGVGNANQCNYVITNGADWEIGIGTVTAGTPNTLSRTTVLANSAGTVSLISFPVGVKKVFCDTPVTRMAVFSAAFTLATSTWGHTPVADVTGDGFVLAGYRDEHILINANMFFWQAGSTFNYSNNTVHIADGWKVSGIGASHAGTVTKSSAYIDRHAGVSKYSANWVHNAGGASSDFVAIHQFIDGVKVVDGVVTVSAKVRCNSGNNQFIFRLAQSFGTGGSPSSSIVVDSPLFTIPASIGLVTATMTLPSVNGKTMGSNSDDYLQVCLLSSNSSLAHNVDIFYIKIEPGFAPTPLLAEDFNIAFLRCQRRYFKTFLLDTTPANGVSADAGPSFGWGSGRAGAVGGDSPNFRFPIMMRAVPTGTTFGIAAGNSNIRDASNSVNLTNTTVRAISNNGMQLTYTGNAATSIGSYLQIHFVADARL